MELKDGTLAHVQQVVNDVVVTPPPNTRTLGDWLTKRRIAISGISFSLLIVFNLFFLGVRPHNPFNPLHIVNAIGTGLIFIGLVIRSWAAGTLHKSQEVTTVGPYALVRNPLYVGSFLMMSGFCILMKDWLAMAFVVGPIAAIYWYQVKVEERNLSLWFHDAWGAYARSTGRFLPRSCSYSVFVKWSASQWWKNREYKAVLATFLALACIAALANR